MSCTRKLLLIGNGPNWNQLLSNLSNNNDDTILDIYSKIDNIDIPTDVIDSAIARYNINGQHLIDFLRANMPANITSEQINTLRPLFQQLMGGGPYVSGRPPLVIPGFEYGIKFKLSRMAWIILFISRHFDLNQTYKILWLLHYILPHSISPTIAIYYQELYSIIAGIIPDARVIDVIGQERIKSISDLKTISKIVTSDPTMFTRQIITYGIDYSTKTSDFIKAINNFQQGIDIKFKKKYKLTTDRLTGLRFKFNFPMKAKPTPEDIKDEQKFIFRDLALYWPANPALILKAPEEKFPLADYVRDAREASRDAQNQALRLKLKSAKKSDNKLVISQTKKDFGKDLMNLFVGSNTVYMYNHSLLEVNPKSQYNFIHNIVVPLMLQYSNSLFDLKARSAVDFLCNTFPHILVLNQPNLIDECINSGLFNIFLHDLIVIENHLRLKAIDQLINKEEIIGSLTQFFDSFVFTDISPTITDDNRYIIQQIYKVYHQILNLLTSEIKSLAAVTDIKMRKKRFEDFQIWAKNTDMYTVISNEGKIFTDDIGKIFDSNDSDGKLNEFINDFKQYLLTNNRAAALPIVNELYQLIDHIILTGIYDYTTLSSIYTILVTLNIVGGYSTSVIINKLTARLIELRNAVTL